MKQCFFNSIGSKYRLDDVLFVIYYKINAFFETRFRDKRGTTLSNSKRLNYYEDRVSRAKSIVNEAMQQGSTKIKILNKEMGCAEVKGERKSGLLKLSAQEETIPIYNVSLCATSCTCGDVLAVACKHILAVAMLLPEAASRFKIGMLSTRQAASETPEEDLEAYLQAVVLPSSPSAVQSSSAAAPSPSLPPQAEAPPEPFLSDAEGANIHATADAHK